MLQGFILFVSLKYEFVKIQVNFGLFRQDLSTFKILTVLLLPITKYLPNIFTKLLKCPPYLGIFTKTDCLAKFKVPPFTDRLMTQVYYFVLVSTFCSRGIKVTKNLSLFHSFVVKVTLESFCTFRTLDVRISKSLFSSRLTRDDPILNTFLLRYSFAAICGNQLNFIRQS